MAGYVVRYIPYSTEVVKFKCTYLDCVAHDGLTILDNEAEVRVMLSEHQGLRANAPSNIDNQRTLREVFPSIPCQFDTSKLNDGVRCSAA